MKWIKCEERLPELKDDNVLVYYSDGRIYMVHILNYFEDIPNGIVGGVYPYTKWYLSQGVTHWMELPKPPQED